MRLKIVAGNLVAVLLLGLLSYWAVSGDLKKHLTGQVHSQISKDAELVKRSLSLTALQFTDSVQQRASDGDVRAVFSALDEDGRRTRAYAAAERSAGWFADPARGLGGAPDIVVVVDDSGKVLARNADRNRMYGKKLALEMPALRSVLSDRTPRHDAWEQKDTGKVLQLGVAPVTSDEGSLLGALVVGYDVSNGVAVTEGQRLGSRDVAFVVPDKVYSSSFSESTAKKLKGTLFGEAKSVTDAALEGNTSGSFIVKLDGSEYEAIAAPVPMAPSAKVAYVVMADRSAVLSVAADSTSIIIMLTVVFFLLSLVYGIIVANSIIRPIETIEEGVLAAINGNTDARLETDDPDLGGLAYRINQLLNVFTGVQEAGPEDDEGNISPAGGGGAAWNDSAFKEPAKPAGGGGGGGAAPAAAAGGGGGGGGDFVDDPAVAQKLEAEPEDTYYTRVYKDYVAAKQAAGENVSNIPEERFIQRLKGNEKALAKKHGCRAVRFQVQTRGNQVALQPVLLR